MKMDLTIRKNGKYYQLGYYNKSKWVGVLQLGTPEKLLKNLDIQKWITYQNNKHKSPQETNETY